MPHYSRRVVQQPNRYDMLDVERKAYAAVIDSFDDDPDSYSGAMVSFDTNL